MNVTSRSTSTMTIGRKLFLSFGSAMALTLLIALVGSVNNAILSHTVKDIVQSMAVQQQLTSEISVSFSELLSIDSEMNLRSLAGDRSPADTYDRQFLLRSNKLSEDARKLDPLLASDSDKRLCSQLIDLNVQLRKVHDLSYQQISAASTTHGAPAPSAYATFRDQFLPTANLAKVRAETLSKDLAALLKEDTQRATRIDLRSRWITNFMLILFFILGGVLSHIIVQSNRTLRKFAADLGRGATQVAAAAAQVSTSSQSLAHGASEQTAFIEATSLSVAKIHAMARRNTENADATASVVAESQRYIHEGNKALDEMVAAMDGIAFASEKISKIVKLIDQIASQTNILALNAAVEAARAGEAGLSFAVLAGEVRDLAQRSAQAAKDTATLIEDCIAKSQTGKLQVDNVAAAIRSITVDSAKVKLLVDEISIGSREQSRGVDLVSKAVLQMEQVTHGTAAGAEQSAAAAKQLNLQFQTLKDIAEDLALMLGGAIQEPPRVPAPAQAAPTQRENNRHAPFVDKAADKVGDKMEERLKSVLHL